MIEESAEKCDKRDSGLEIGLFLAVVFDDMCLAVTKIALGLGERDGLQLTSCIQPFSCGVGERQLITEGVPRSESDYMPCGSSI